ncbi:ABC transporter permease [candidate division KSB1 bacterium]|nr:ABC transporter permease [candidate division KSB1 bacterium]
MLKNYVKNAYRNYMRQKGTYLINITGLAIGMVVCIYIFQYVGYEMSYDKFHENSNNLYRVQYNFFKNGEKKIESASAVAAVGPAMKNNFPEVQDFTRAFRKSGILSYNNMNCRERQIYAVTPSFLSIFSFPLIKGNYKTALSDPFKAVITESAAKRYFGEEDPIGKMIQWDGEHEGKLNFEIAGICKDVPENSHIKFNCLLSYQTFIHIRGDGGEILENDWHWYDFYTYILLRPGSDSYNLQGKCNELLAVGMKEVWDKYNIKEEFVLQPIKDIHLYSNLGGELEPDDKGDGKTVKILILIAIFILIIAWVNYINLTTANAMQRAKEVGIRKVSGATRLELIGQFILESTGITIIALIFAVVIVCLSNPVFNKFTNMELLLNLKYQSGLWMILIGIFLAGTFLSALYPAFVLSSFKPITAIKSIKSPGGIQMRKYMVIFQFITSIILIAVVFIISNQLSFMRNQDLKIDITQTLVIHGPTKISSESVYITQHNTFRDEMLKQSQVMSFSAGTKIPGLEISSSEGIWKKEDSPDDIRSINLLGIDHNYLTSFNVDIISGRTFSKSFATDVSNILINEAAVKMLGYENPEKTPGHEIFFRGNYYKIIGVVDNYHHMSLKTAPVPILYYLNEYCNTFFVLKIENENINNTIKMIENKWQQHFPGNPFDYFFLDEYFDKQYKYDQDFRNLLVLFSILACFIASLGLFALASFSTVRRSKEIGVRKVLGASIFNIVKLLSKDFITLVIISNVIAWPVIYYVMNKWLQNFAYRVNIGFQTLLFAGLLVMLVAFFAISLQTIRAAMTNPAEVLKYE